MDTDLNTFWDILLWSFWIFIWISAIIIWFRCLVDLFSDKTTSGVVKVIWTLVLVLLPWIGALIYLLARGRGMGERQLAAAAELQERQESYIRSVAAASATPAEQIDRAKSLLDSGAITQEEFDALKAKALV
jgi:Na+/proline symporter